MEAGREERRSGEENKQKKKRLGEKRGEKGREIGKTQQMPFGETYKHEERDEEERERK